MLVTFHAHGETGRYHSYRRGSNNLDQIIRVRLLEMKRGYTTVSQEEKRLTNKCIQREMRYYSKYIKV